MEIVQSHPMWVRGLKLYKVISDCDHLESHPMWVRGLKRTSVKKVESQLLSHPMWVRGLKHPRRHLRRTAHSVAPYVGAWIETGRQGVERHSWQSHPMWVRGLKHGTLDVLLMFHLSHPMWVRGLKPTSTAVITSLSCRTLCGCVD